MEQIPTLETPRLYTAAQVARLLNVMPDTVLKWCKRGLLSHYKTPGIRGAVRIGIDDVRDFLARHRVERSKRPTDYMSEG